MFKAEFTEGNLYLEKNGFNYNLTDFDALNHLVKNHHHVTSPYQQNIDWSIQGHCLKMNFLNATLSKENLTSSSKSPTYYNYYLGKDSKKWKSKVSAYQELLFEDVYPNVDLKINTSGSNFKYDLILKTNANIQDIKINYEGADSLYLINGNLHLKTSINEVIEKKPYAYQIINGKKTEVACAFILDKNKVHFSLPNSYEKNYDLIIDPEIIFSRYSSSSANNFGYTATYDSEGNAYGAGSVFNVGYITTPGAFDVSFNGASTDIGITKYSSDGLQRIYATYLGGDQTELPHSIVVNSKDELFVFGTTSSSDYPVSASCFDSTFAGGTLSNLSQGLGVIYNFGTDIIISSFSEDGTALLASTYLGGSLNDGLNLSSVLLYNYADEVRGEIFIDDQDNVLVTSCTYSSDFPVLNSIDTSHNGLLDGIVFKMNEDLSDLNWSTYLGGSKDDAVYSVSLDVNQNLLLAGGTQSLDFPVSNAYQDTFNGGRSDGFISKIHSSGANLISSTYLGSDAYDQIYFIENNREGNVYIFGQTIGASGVLISNAAYNEPTGGQLLTKFNAAIDTVIWSTRFGDGGTLPDISPTAFLVDVCNQVFLSGWGTPSIAGNVNLSGTGGLDITNDAIDTTTDNSDFYFMVLRDDASALIYASFFGGSTSREHVDGGTSRFDKKGVIYQAVCAGCGNNQDFPTVPVDSIGFWNNNNSCNLGLVKYAFTPPSILADFNIPEVDCTPLSLFFENLSKTAFNDTSASSFTWKVNDSIISSYHLNYDFIDAGTYDITLIAIDSNSCNFIDSITKQFTIIGNSNQNLATLTTCANKLIQIGIDPINGGNISYSWTPTNNLSNPNISNPFVALTERDTFTLIISNGNCVDTFIQEILVEEIQIELNYRDSICLNDTFSVSATSLTNVFYQWEPDSLLQTNQGGNDAIFIAENPMLVSCTATSSIGCTAFAEATITVFDVLPDLEVSANPDTVEQGNSSELNAFSSVVNDFLWDNDSTLSSLTTADPIATPLETRTYTVRINDGICPNKKAKTIYVKLPACIEGKIFVPNAFTPNGDGKNDIFFVRSAAVIDDFYFTVFDRWGQQIFETNNSTEGWDGTFKSSNLSPAAFAWYCAGKCENGDPFFIKGNVSLIK